MQPTTPSLAPGSKAGFFLARRVYGPRIAGTALSAICVWAALPANAHTGLTWALMALCGLAWPHLAYWRARQAPEPLKTEIQHLLVDSVIAGFWVNAIQFQLLPSILLLMVTALGNITTGGVRLALKGFAAHGLGMVLGAAVWGWQVAHTTSLEAQWGMVPLLVLYPLLMGHIMHGLAHRLNEHRQALKHLSERDTLADVYNRRYFDQHLRQVFSQLRRNERPMTLLASDIDHFKPINDQHGHGIGDEVLRLYAQTLSSCARAGDVVARMGGDEFAVLLSDSTPEQARAYILRVQSQLHNALGARPELPPTTVSFGAAMARGSMRDHEDWFEQADAALYQTKASERGGITFAPLTVPVPI